MAARADTATRNLQSCLCDARDAARGRGSTWDVHGRWRCSGHVHGRSHPARMRARTSTVAVVVHGGAATLDMSRGLILCGGSPRGSTMRRGALLAGVRVSAIENNEVARERATTLGTPICPSGECGVSTGSRVRALGFVRLRLFLLFRLFYAQHGNARSQWSPSDVGRASIVVHCPSPAVRTFARGNYQVG